MNSFDTLFLDRDGVINKKLEGRYVRHFSEFEFMPGFLDVIPKLSDLFIRIFIITNQQGIGKKIMKESDLHCLHDQMQNKIKKSGAEITKIYYCPHLEEENCLCRKPKPGMIQQAMIDFPTIKIKDSYFVGDSVSDILAGKKMNLKTIKVNNDYTLAKWTEDLLRFI